MAYKEYEGLDTEKAIAKLLSKGIHDAEDKDFARARAEYLTPEQLAAITGDEIPQTDSKPEVKAPEGNDANQTPPSADATVEGVELVTESLKLDELQAIAAEAGLDTSGKKADLIERINTDRKEKASAKQG